MTDEARARMQAALDDANNVAKEYGWDAAVLGPVGVNVRSDDLATVLAQPAGVAAGWVLVPVEPTEAMFMAEADISMLPRDDEATGAAWSAMLAAAPPAPSLPADRDDTAALVEALNLIAGIRDLNGWSARQMRRIASAALANRTPPQPASAMADKIAPRGMIPPLPPQPASGEVTE